MSSTAPGRSADERRDRSVGVVADPSPQAEPQGFVARPGAEADALHPAAQADLNDFGTCAIARSLQRRSRRGYPWREPQGQDARGVALVPRPAFLGAGTEEAMRYSALSLIDGAIRGNAALRPLWRRSGAAGRL